MEKIVIKVPSLRIKNIKKNLPGKRAFFLSSGKMKGSMALEGSMVLPLFLFFMMTVLLSLETVRFQSDMQQALHQAGNRKAFEEYQVKYAGKGRMDTKKQLIEYLDSQIYPYLCVAGEEGGVSFYDLSCVETDGQIELLAKYRIKPFINWLPIGEVCFEDKFFGHSWTGYLGGEGEVDQTEEVFVYITKTGSKYHMSRNCTYLRVKIRSVSYDQIPGLRNQSGGKYYPCLKCKPAKGGIVYLTAEGGSYHSQSDCMALKRTIYMVPLSEAEEKGYNACSKCGS